MRLYLASNDLGNFAEVLVDLVGGNKNVLMISNARDHRSADDRKAIVDEDAKMLSDCGFSVTELDLRKFFGRSGHLRKYIDDFVPGLVFAMGGNLYSLATALRLSGMDEIIQTDLASDKYVYGGYSAGSMVAARDLMNYADSFGQQSGDRLEQAEELYGELSTDGLGLIGEYIIPHADEDKFKLACKEAEASISHKGLTPIVLNNTDVVVLRDEKIRVFKSNS